MIQKVRVFCLLFASTLLGLSSLNVSASYLKAKEIYSKNDESYLAFIRTAEELFQDKIYYSTLPLLKEALYLKNNEEDQRFDELLEKIIKMVGTEHFRGLSETLLKKSRIPSFNFILATKAFKEKKAELALEYLAKIPKSHFLYPQTLLLTGSIFELSGNYQKAFLSFRTCIKYAKSMSSDSDISAQASSYDFIADTCNINIARTHYKAGNHKESHILYRKMEKASFKWPHSLLEDSWNTYIFDDMGKTIGRLYTYKAPLLQSYFIPENEILTTISFLRLCMWDDALGSIKFYDEHFTKDGQALVSLFQKNKNVPSYFYNLAYNSPSKNLASFAFLSNILEGIKRKPYLLRHSLLQQNFQNELKILSVHEESMFKRSLIANLNESIGHEIKMMNEYIKKDLYTIAQEAIKTSIALGKIQLGIYSKQKKKIYNSKELIDESKIGDRISLHATVNQYYWGPLKEFWLDELGDYVFMLESICPKN